MSYQKELTEFYNKYNEEKRLLRPYGRVEYITTMNYIEKYIGERKNLKIIDIGCATGRYALPLAEEGHQVTAVDIVPYNIGILKQKAEKAGISIEAHVGDALNLKKYKDNSYNIVLYLGPIYHLFTADEKIQALKEAKRILKPGGLLFISYIMNEFGVLLYGIKEGQILDSISQGKLDQDFHIRNDISDLFSFDRLEDIDFYKEQIGMERVQILSQDGPTNYMREIVTDLTEEQFEAFLNYHLATCERPDILGAGNHTLDILKKGDA